MTWSHANKLHLKKHTVTCYGATAFSIFSFANPNLKKKKESDCLQKEELHFWRASVHYMIWQRLWLLTED